MPPKESGIDFGSGIGTLYIEGNPVTGIESFECDTEAVYFEHRDEIFKICNADSFTVTVKMNVKAFYKLTGLYDWVCNNCPNRKVVHLIKYGKTGRIQKKNFKRAIRIIVNILEG
jgi:hypothetical protein